MSDFPFIQICDADGQEHFIRPEHIVSISYNRPGSSTPDHLSAINMVGGGRFPMSESAYDISNDLARAVDNARNRG